MRIVRSSTVVILARPILSLTITGSVALVDVGGRWAMTEPDEEDGRSGLQANRCSTENSRAGERI
jgi:hypothetical protein